MTTEETFKELGRTAKHSAEVFAEIAKQLSKLRETKDYFDYLRDIVVNSACSLETAVMCLEYGSCELERDARIIKSLSNKGFSSKVVIAIIKTIKE